LALVVFFKGLDDSAKVWAGKMTTQSNVEKAKGLVLQTTRAEEEVRIVLRDSAWIKSGMLRIVMRPKGTCYIVYLA
jgi:hypothetical protein